MRAWIYQSCTQFSYFQTPSEYKMRSSTLTLDFYKQWCADIFGEGTWPLVSRVNNRFGGLELKATNLFLSNADEGTPESTQIPGNGPACRKIRTISSAESTPVPAAATASTSKMTPARIPKN
jgi:hypothetical protein